MVVMTTLTDQTLQPGQALSFDKIASQSGNGESGRAGGPVNLTACCGAYEVMAGANVTGATAAEPVQLAIAVEGSPLLGTTMIYTPAVADAVGHIFTGTYVPVNSKLPTSVTLVNNGTNPITVSAGAILAIKREG